MSHTVKLIPLIGPTVSTLNPTVGIVVTVSFSLILYSIVVFPVNRVKENYNIFLGTKMEWIVG